MLTGTRPFRRSCASAALALVLAQLVLSCATPPTLSKPGIDADLRVGSDYQGPVRRIAFDGSGDAWMATDRTLYRVREGKAEALDPAVGRDTQLALAPGGRVYAWLLQGTAPAGLFTVQLLEIPKKPLAELRLPEFPFGFGTLYLGGDGRLIVTATPLQDAEGLGGEFLYVFWSSDGQMLSRVILEGPRIGVMDEAGEALLLLGKSDAIAFRNDGQQLWRLDGRFRKGALAAQGTVALLNPAETNVSDEVHVYRNGNVTRVKLSSSVYALALAADGSEGAVGIGTGELFFVAPKSCQATACKLRNAGLNLDTPYMITALRFIDSTTVAIGRIKRVGTKPPYLFPEGAVVAMSTSGGVSLFERTVPLEQPATWSPTIEVTYGLPFFAAHTPDSALFVSLRR